MASMPERATQTAGGSSRAEHDRADYPPLIPDLLEHRAMPEVANALRAVTPRVAEEWQRLVHRVIPSADRLTFEQIRDDLPIVLNMIADALGAASAEQARTLLHRTSQHGVQRYEQAYQER